MPTAKTAADKLKADTAAHHDGDTETSVKKPELGGRKAGSAGADMGSSSKEATPEQNKGPGTGSEKGEAKRTGSGRIVEGDTTDKTAFAPPGTGTEAAGQRAVTAGRAVTAAGKEETRDLTSIWEEVKRFTFLYRGEECTAPLWGGHRTESCLESLQRFYQKQGHSGPFGICFQGERILHQ